MRKGEREREREREGGGGRERVRERERERDRGRDTCNETFSLQQVHEALDQQLTAARLENSKISRLMGEMGESPRPTVAQWLQQKQQQKKRNMQEALMSWDR